MQQKPNAAAKPKEEKRQAKESVVSGSLFYNTPYYEGAIFQKTGIKNDLAPGDNVWLNTPPNRDELRNPRKEDAFKAKQLIAHLNENVEYYHKAIWWNMSPERRFMLLDGYIAPNSNGKSIVSVVENRLIGIVGNSLVMPVSRGYNLDPSFIGAPLRNLEGDVIMVNGIVQRETIDLLSHYMPTTPIPPYRVSVPTKGVFAEAVMGACNSCEKIDNDRFWKWEEHPIDDPTAINPISAPVPTFNNPNLAAKDFAQPIVNIQNAPAVPDPQGVNAVAGLLGKELFKDITGLDQNQQNALQAMLEGGKGSNEAMKAGMDMAQLAQQYATIKDAKEKGLISDADAKESTKKLLDNAVNKDGKMPQDNESGTNGMHPLLAASMKIFRYGS